MDPITTGAIILSAGMIISAAMVSWALCKVANGKTTNPMRFSPEARSHSKPVECTENPSTLDISAQQAELQMRLSEQFPAHLSSGVEEVVEEDDLSQIKKSLKGIG